MSSATKTGIFLLPVFLSVGGCAQQVLRQELADNCGVYTTKYEITGSGDDRKERPLDSMFIGFRDDCAKAQEQQFKLETAALILAKYHHYIGAGNYLPVIDELGSIKNTALKNVILEELETQYGLTEKVLQAIEKAGETRIPVIWKGPDADMVYFPPPRVQAEPEISGP